MTATAGATGLVRRRTAQPAAGGVTLVVWAAAIGCAGRTAAVQAAPPRGPNVSGRYALVSYNGQRIPADQGGIPTRDGRPSGCRLVVTAGDLTLDVPGGRFAYGYDQRDSCDQRLLGRALATGLLTQRGDSLAFRIPRVQGSTPLDTIAFTGSWSAGTVTVRSGGDVLVFR